MTGPLTALHLAATHAFTFKGRATRAEFWWVALFAGIAGIVTSIMDGIKIQELAISGDPMALYNLGPLDFATTYYMLITAIPLTTLSVRRLHDVGLSGFWVVVQFVPIVGSLIALVMFGMPSSKEASIHGAAKGPVKDIKGKPVTADAHKRAMQGYAVLFDKDKPVTAEMQAARKAEVADYYRSRVLKASPSA